ncbi:hypothetical protein C8R43DRAFT_961531 [Mycena crocata]|nr:hypothetical protein C8R43DRAFT_961531 [Mycena crocata]
MEMDDDEKIKSTTISRHVKHGHLTEMRVAISQTQCHNVAPVTKFFLNTKITGRSSGFSVFCGLFYDNFTNVNPTPSSRCLNVVKDWRNNFEYTDSGNDGQRNHCAEIQKEVSKLLFNSSKIENTSTTLNPLDFVRWIQKETQERLEARPDESALSTALLEIIKVAMKLKVPRGDSRSIFRSFRENLVYLGMYENASRPGFENFKQSEGINIEKAFRKVVRSLACARYGGTAHISIKKLRADHKNSVRALKVPPMTLEELIVLAVPEHIHGLLLELAAPRETVSGLSSSYRAVQHADFI